MCVTSEIVKRYGKQSKHELEEELIKLGFKNTPIQVYAGKDETLYHMGHSRRGRALIFNQQRFQRSDLAEREGTEKDAQDLKNVLTKRGFDVRIYNDKTLSFIRKELKSVAKEDHTNEDCILGTK